MLLLMLASPALLPMTGLSSLVLSPVFAGFVFSLLPVSH